MPEIETVIVGAGVVGLAIARALALSGREVLVLERHGLIGSETSSRNSEVIHAGIYYPKGSLKAQSCVRGRHMLYEFCRSHGVPHKRTGKLIVATNEEQSNRLRDIAAAALANGVDDLKWLSREEVGALEPELNANCALLSPSTGIIDSHALMLALQADMENCGGQIAFHSELAGWKKLPSGDFQLICLSGGEETVLNCRELILSCGLMATKTWGRGDNSFGVPKTRYAKGNYFKLAGRAPFSRLVYPVPEPGGLGVHLTLDLSGEARFGPDVEWVDEPDYQVDQNRSKKFYAAIRDYWPGLKDDQLEADYSGIRPKIVSKGEPAADFRILGPQDHDMPGLVALFGIESPGLTASLALAETAKSALD